ncbi:MAG: fumarylacetoacetate hydrolase family protein [Niveispirillum sp.]|uniref:fumarylacetoacetate hydrolase family protein n=1 Tax=Niveispirillum sp. TaxID=1917217 RepID=UPI004035CE28
MSYAITPPALVTLPVAGSDALFPVGRLFCVGRNYAAHAREMGASDREPPFFFMKPASAVLPGGGTMPYPPQTSDLHHEIELVVALGDGGSVYGYGVGLDLTRRDLQGEAKKAGKPWDMGKVFDHAAPVSALVPAAAVPSVDAGRIALSVNGELRQEGDLAEMIWTVPEIIAELSRFITLLPGDLIFTGTPAGVGPIQRGDRLDGVVAGIGTLSVTVA